MITTQLQNNVLAEKNKVILCQSAAMYQNIAWRLTSRMGFGWFPGTKDTIRCQGYQGSGKLPDAKDIKDTKPTTKDTKDTIA